MSVELVNSHVLIAHRANYGDSPDWERKWSSDVVDSEFGEESRFAQRLVPRAMLKWTVTAAELAEQSQLADRIMAAKKLGKACAPYWGRGSELAIHASEDTATIETSFWPWAIGDYIIFIDDNGNFDVRQLDNVAGTSLTLNAPLSRLYRSGTFCWPLIFGRFNCDNMKALTQRNGEVAMSIQELTSPDAEAIGTADAPIDGIAGENIPGWIIGSTFIVH